MPFHLDHPNWLWLLLLIVPAALLALRSLAWMDSLKKAVVTTLRIAVLTLLVVILAMPQAVRWNRDLTLVAVVDQSQSIRQLARPPRLPDQDTPQHPPFQFDDWLLDWLTQSSKNHRPNDRLGLVGFNGRPTVHSLPSPAFSITSDPTSGGSGAPGSGGTDIAAGIRLGMALFEPDSGKRLLLVTDGNDTASPDGTDLLAAARQAKAAGIPIDVLPIEYQTTHEVLVDGVHAPDESRQGQTVPVRIVLRATAPTQGLLYLQHDGQLIDLNGPDPGQSFPVSNQGWTLQESTSPANPPLASDSIQAPPPPTGTYLWMRQFDVALAATGPNRFDALFEPPPGSDAIAVNNRGQAHTMVQGKGKILFVDNIGPPHGRILPDALLTHGIELELVTPESLPNRLATLQRYDAVILQDVPADQISIRQQKMLASYVNDLGGGLLMIGGPNSFAAGAWTNSPVDQILPVYCQVPNTTVLPSGALVIVLDRSGSMSEGVSGSRYNKQEIANEAAVLALQTLYPQDKIGVVAFDHSPKWIVKLRNNTDPKAVARLIRKIQPEGGTNIAPALEEAYQALAPLSSRDAAVKHIILLTDGQSGSGPYEEIAKKMIAADITLSTIGVGNDVDAKLLQSLATMCAGHYHPVTDPNKLPQAFIREARTIRKNVIKETPFEPQVVPSGSPIVSGLGRLPPLQGFVLTGPKPAAYTPIRSPQGEPIFAHWQVGLGRTAAFTSDATNRWAKHWLHWTGYPDFWARTVRAIARPPASRDYELITSFERNRLHIRLDASAVHAGPIRGDNASPADLRIAGAVLDPQGQTLPVTLQQTAPGVYEATAPAQDPGHYAVSLFVNPASTTQPPASTTGQWVIGGLTRLPGDELRSFRSNRARLEEIATITGGRVLDPRNPQPDLLFDRQSVVATRSVRPLWNTLMVWLLAIFLLDVAARRLAWDWDSIKSVSARWATSWRRWGQPRDIQPATLDALKRRAQQLDQSLSPPATAPPIELATTQNQNRKSKQINIFRNIGGDNSAPTHLPPSPDPQPPTSESNPPEKIPQGDPRALPGIPGGLPGVLPGAGIPGGLFEAKRRARQQMDSDRET